MWVLWGFHLLLSTSGEMKLVVSVGLPCVSKLAGVTGLTHFDPSAVSSSSH